ncbi:hypothetical protein B0H17DRAFT_1265673 [Mycena rosella]|uniref:glutathione transferase n=1 Tax=Mycena rosella TaxID=1033263 RepID=A0AAD7DT81_MYCRO|nr:hypothetical protein B0H17DRAFT_1265673 [Mycena rosella]
MVLKLYGPEFTAGDTGLVAMALAEKQILFELVFVDMFTGVHKGADHTAKQLFAQVPAIDHKGFLLYKNRVICRYLEDTCLTQSTVLLHPIRPGG